MKTTQSQDQGALYQLWSPTITPVGAYVEIRGAGSPFGTVWKSEAKDGKFLNLIRGHGRIEGMTPVKVF